MILLMGPIFTIFYSASSDLVEFCKNSRCPAKLAETGPQFSLDCCVWHANVHVCHPGDCGTPVSIQTDGWINRQTN